MTNFKEILEKYSAMLPVGTSVSYTEAERRAGEFLSIMAKITDWRHSLGSEKIRLLTTQTAVYANEMGKGAGKTVTQDKINAEASEAYITAREELEQVENDLSYLKAYYDVFNNGHIFYRTLAKGENS